MKMLDLEVKYRVEKSKTNSMQAELRTVENGVSSTISIPPSTVGSASHRHRYSALLVHALGLLFLGAAWILMDLVGEFTAEGNAVQGVGCAAALVLALWSGVLAIRALVAGEPPGWPVAVLALGLAEAALPCLFVWWPLLISYDPNSPVMDLVVALGLPVFVPFLAFATFLAAPLAWWLTRRAEKKSVANGQPAWERRRCWKRGVAWYAVGFVALTLLVLPYPLYLFCVGSVNKRWYERENKDESNWRMTAIGYTPDFVKAFVDGWVERIPGASAVYLRQKMVNAGKLPKDRILAHLQDSDTGNIYAAWRQLEWNYPRDAAELANSIASGQVPASSTMEIEAGDYVGGKGSEERVRELLRSPQTSTNTLEGLLSGLGYACRTEFQPELKELIRRPPPVAKKAWRTLTRLITTPQQGRQVFEEIFNDPELEHRSATVENLSVISEPSLRDAMVLGFLKDKDLTVRQKAMFAAVRSLKLNQINDTEFRFGAIEYLSILLAWKDLILRRGAVGILAPFLKIPIPNTPSAYDCVTGEPTTDKGGTPAPETPAELQELETLREAAKAWLEKNR